MEKKTTRDSVNYIYIYMFFRRPLLFDRDCSTQESVQCPSKPLRGTRVSLHSEYQEDEDGDGDDGNDSDIQALDRYILVIQS